MIAYESSTQPDSRAPLCAEEEVPARGTEGREGNEPAVPACCAAGQEAESGAGQDVLA